MVVQRLGRVLASELGGRALVARSHRDGHITARGNRSDDGRHDLADRLGVEEMQDHAENKADWLTEPDHLSHAGIAENSRRVTEVALGRGDPIGTQQGSGMGHHYRVVIDIGHPAGRIDRLGYLVGVLRSRQARADVHELPDAPFRHPVHRPGQEQAVLPHFGRQRRIGLQQPIGLITVSGEIVLAAQPVVIDAGNIRPADGERGMRRPAAGVQGDVAGRGHRFVLSFVALVPFRDGRASRRTIRENSCPIDSRTRPSGRRHYR